MSVTEENPRTRPKSSEFTVPRRRFGLPAMRRPSSAPEEVDVTPEVAKPAAPRVRRRTAIWVGVVTCVALLIGVLVPSLLLGRSAQSPAATRPIPYLGVYERNAPDSYAGVAAFTSATGVQPDLLMYYSAWMEPFNTQFALTAAAHGAAPLVQINPTGVSLAEIAAGKYDTYLTSYADTVRSYVHPVILSFGHEMNGHWYSWGYRGTTPAVFVAAWRHIVTLFRQQGASNVIWLWTVNIVAPSGGIPYPRPWWPGNEYVNWVGIDGYYYNSSLTFVPLFGPTIAAVRELTSDPILIAETAAPPAIQPEKIQDLFAGIHLYGLLGFVWFNAVDKQDWRLRSPAAIHALRSGATGHLRRAS
jgi:mannan endo-1,4-beta-mannosidase